VFLEFTLSELLPIFLWSFFKEPEDCFRDYICQGSKHVSIFQMNEEGFGEGGPVNPKLQKTSQAHISGESS